MRRATHTSLRQDAWVRVAVQWNACMWDGRRRGGGGRKGNTDRLAFEEILSSTHRDITLHREPKPHGKPVAESQLLINFPENEEGINSPIFCSFEEKIDNREQ